MAGMEDTFARVVAVAALLFSLSSLAWNVYSWRRSGHHVIVNSPHGATPRDGVIWLEVRNSGRAAVRVVGVGLRLNATKPWPDGAKFPTAVQAQLVSEGNGPFPEQPQLPYLLEPSEVVEWRFHLGQLYPDASLKSHLIDLEREYLGRPCVFLGTGEVVKSRATRYIAVRFRERWDQWCSLRGSHMGG